MTNIHIRAVAAPLLVVALLAGCAPALTRPDSPRVTSQHVVDKNYELGKTNFAYVGNPIIRYKDYIATKTEMNAMQSDVDIAFERPIFGQDKSLLIIPKGEKYEVVGTYIEKKEVGNEVLTVLQSPKENLSITVNASGKAKTKFVNSMQNGKSVGLYVIQTPEAVFTRSVATNIDKTSGYQNFEILYSGRTVNNISLTYREYTPDDIARPAFAQNLTYDSNEKLIRFKNFQIEIIAVSNGQIDYRVLSE